MSGPIKEGFISEVPREVLFQDEGGAGGTFQAKETPLIKIWNSNV